MPRWNALVVVALLLAACSKSTSTDAQAGPIADAAPDVDAAGLCPEQLDPNATDATIETVTAERCAIVGHHGNHDFAEYTSLCAGSLVYVQAVGDDCALFWLFDPSTHRLQAAAHGCNQGATCTASISGFVFHGDCFGEDFVTNYIDLCPEFPDAGTYQAGLRFGVPLPIARDE